MVDVRCSGRNRSKWPRFPSRNMVSLGIVGLDSSYPESFAQRLEATGIADLDAVWDGGDVRDDAYVDAFCERHGATRYDDIESMAAVVDGVMILTVDWDTHLPLSRLFFDAGVAVLIDKPIAGRLADVEALEELARGGRLFGGSMHPTRLRLPISPRKHRIEPSMPSVAMTPSTMVSTSSIPFPTSSGRSGPQSPRSLRSRTGSKLPSRTGPTPRFSLALPSSTRRRCLLTSVAGPGSHGSGATSHGTARPKTATFGGSSNWSLASRATTRPRRRSGDDCLTVRRSTSQPTPHSTPESGSNPATNRFKLSRPTAPRSLQTTPARHPTDTVTRLPASASQTAIVNALWPPEQRYPPPYSKCPPRRTRILSG